MAVTISIRDETATGNIYHEIPLQFPSERITVRELIRERVYQEVQDFNQKENEQIFRGLIQPTDTERILNGFRPEYRLKKHRQIDWKIQFNKSLEAFEKNGYFILIDNQQAESLDQEFSITSKTEISFIKLTLLVGG